MNKTAHIPNTKTLPPESALKPEPPKNTLMESCHQIYNSVIAHPLETPEVLEVDPFPRYPAAMNLLFVFQDLSARVGHLSSAIKSSDKEGEQDSLIATLSTPLIFASSAFITIDYLSILGWLSHPISILSKPLYIYRLFVHFRVAVTPHLYIVKTFVHF